MKIYLISFLILIPNLGSAYLNEQTSLTMLAKRIRKENLTTVNETSDADGVIRHISWQGRHHPDLKNLLGPCFNPYDDFMSSTPQLRLRGAVTIERDGCHINIGGHMGNVQGEVSLDK